MKRVVLIVMISFLIQNIYGDSSFETMTGLIYRKDSSFKDLIYIQKESRELNNYGEIITHNYYDTYNRLEAFETVYLVNEEIVNYKTEIKGLGLNGSIDVEDEILIFTRIKDNRVKVKELRKKDNFITGPMLPSFVERSIGKLLEGNKVEFHLPYFDMMIQIPMIIELADIQTNKRENSVVVEMHLKNIFLNFLIDSVYMIVDLDSYRIIEINGPTILPDPKDKDRADFVDANIFYEYKGDKNDFFD